ncbi:MAG TPA: SBBP repeat-containing protein [Vicinamibacteria bacterium]
MRTTKAFPRVTATAAFAAAVMSWSPGLPAAPLEAHHRLAGAYGRIPLQFEANRGQTDDQVEFLLRGGRYTLFLTRSEAVLALASPQGAASRALDAEHSGSSVIRMKLLGAKPKPEVTGMEELPGKVNYFIGSDPRKWRTNVPVYAKVRYADVYPGVDLLYHGRPGHLECDFVVAPGADPRTIALSFEGADRLESDARGDLVLHVAGGEVRQRKPFVYQEVDGVRREVSGGWVLDGGRRVGFHLGAYDPAKPLVIDPVLVYSTYVGGRGDDLSGGIAVDPAGNAYATGWTQSASFPTTPGALDASLGGGQDAFVTKLNPAGNALVYSTYLGGGDIENGNAIAVDAAGNAWVAGATRSRDFPTTPAAFDTTFNGDADGFVAKLDPTGSALLYSTYLGGSDLDACHAIAVDAAGNAFLTGRTRSADFPATPSLNGAQDAFVAKLDPTGSALVYSIFLGGSMSSEEGNGITVDAAGSAYVTGETNSSDFPTTLGAYDTTLDGTADAFVTKVDPAGSGLVYSTYLGGPGHDIGTVIAVDSAGSAYVSGHTFANGFPTTPGAFDTSYNGGPLDVFVTRLNPAGSAPLLFSTYLGGSGSDFGFGLRLDSAGNVYVAGETRSADFPTTPDAIQASAPGGFSDCFVTKLDPTGSSQLYSTYLGGAASDSCFGLALGGPGTAYVVGDTNSTDFPTTPGAFDTSANGGFDVFVAKIGDQPAVPPLDHFKCYDGQFPKFEPRTVLLEDQFVREEAVAFRPHLFCNPVSKNDEPIRDPDAHLKVYSIRAAPAHPPLRAREVVATDQFGEERLRVLRPSDLALPAQKAPHAAPVGLDHFKCYDVEHSAGSPPFQPREVVLRDQFVTERVRVVEPRLLCTPVSKNGEPIHDAVMHLKGYVIEPVGPAKVDRTVVVRDQFGTETLTAQRARVLLVPAEKRLVEAR